jgi:hypothetical protein
VAGAQGEETREGGSKSAVVTTCQGEGGKGTKGGGEEGRRGTAAERRRARRRTPYPAAKGGQHRQKEVAAESTAERAWGCQAVREGEGCKKARVGLTGTCGEAKAGRVPSSGGLPKGSSRRWQPARLWTRCPPPVQLRGGGRHSPRLSSTNLARLGVSTPLPSSAARAAADASAPGAAAGRGAGAYAGVGGAAGGWHGAGAGAGAGAGPRPEDAIGLGSKNTPPRAGATASAAAAGAGGAGGAGGAAGAADVASSPRRRRSGAPEGWGSGVGARRNADISSVSVHERYGPLNPVSRCTLYM